MRLDGGRLLFPLRIAEFFVLDKQQRAQRLRWLPAPRARLKCIPALVAVKRSQLLQLSLGRVVFEDQLQVVQPDIQAASLEMVSFG